MSIDFQSSVSQFSVMDREIEWIKAALARDRSKTQTGLASALGIDKSSVSRLLRGERRLKFAEARLAAAYLEVEPPTGFSEDDESFVYHEPPASGATVPLFRTVSADEDGAWRLDRTRVIERRQRGPMLAGVHAAFGIYAPDDAMAPRFKIGEIAWINPSRPSAPGEDALLVGGDENEDGETAILCEIQTIEKGRLIVRQHRHKSLKSFRLGDWRVMYVLPRW